jgi:hypothetical protein
MKTVDLKQHHKTVYSQFGQDGVLEEIFNNIGLTNKYFIEFGSHGNMTGQGNTPYLREKLGMDGLLMDGEDRAGEFDVKIHVVTSDNINQLFEKYNVPEEADFLSIDVDGADWHIWRALDQKYRPRVVSIECNPHYETYVDTIEPDSRRFGSPHYYSGCSLLAAKILGNIKGYSLVAYCGVDAIFVRDDIIVEKELDFVDVNNHLTIGKRLYNEVHPIYPGTEAYIRRVNH